MKRYYLILIIIVFVALFIASNSAVSNEQDYIGLDNTPVPTRHSVYNFLDRLEVRGLIVFRDNMKPLTNSEIVQYLEEVALVVSNFPERFYMGGREKKELLRYLAEFNQSDKPEFTTNIGKARQKFWHNFLLYRDELNLYSYYGESVDIQINPVLHWNFTSDSTGETITRRISGINIAAGIGSKTAVYFDFRDTQERGRGPYNRGERYKLYEDKAAFVTMDGENVAYYDITRAIMAMKFGNLYLNFGRGDNEWGAGKVENFLVSDNPPAFDFFSARYKLTDFINFSYMTGFLHSYPEVYQSIDTTSTGNLRKQDADKYISAHRLEIYPFRGVEIGLSESVVYGERGLVPAYLNPFNLYLSAQNNLGDMDNVAWSGDVELNLVRGFSLYGELFIDDMRTSKLGTNSVSNKFAYNTGLFIVDPIGIMNTDLIIDYACLDPFVYTHFYPINVYKNWNSSLGYSLPPNSDRWYFRLNWKPFYTFSGGISATFIRHGANTDEVNVGGDIDIPLTQEVTTAPFLAGDMTKTTIVEFDIRWEPLENYFLEGGMRYHKWSGGDENEWSVSFGLNLW